VAEYNIGLSEKLLESADIIAKDGINEFDTLQTVLYLSLLSTEIALKALLERAGQPLDKIKRRSHNLNQLLGDLGKCEIEVEITPGNYRWLSASRIRGVIVDQSYANATVGTMIEKTDVGTSTYPNGIRYGESIRHFSPELVQKMARQILTWAKQNASQIRLAPASP
jgi:hypothetical protein